MTYVIVANTFNPKPGDIIGFRRKFYSHYAFYIGQDRYLHKDNVNAIKIQSKVCIQSLSEIEGTPYIANYQFKNMYEDELSYMESLRIGLESLEDKSYNIFTNNCEHFVTNVKFGKRVSKQVVNLRIYFMIISFILLYVK